MNRNECALEKEDPELMFYTEKKKYLSSQQSNMSDSRKKLLLTSPEKVEPSKLNIEDIIKSRKEGQKYIPLSHKGL